MSTLNSPAIDSSTAWKAIQAAAAKAAEIGVNMSIAIVDASAVLKAFLRMDGASLISLSIAQDKAYTSAATGVSTDAWHDFIKDDAPLLHGIVHVPRFVIFGGGSPIKEAGTIIGAIGVSGGHYSQDMLCAEAALEALRRAQ
jgi:uncharacterized protein GlcG (DUF336 family)